MTYSIHHNSTLRSKAKTLIKAIEDDPDLVVHIRAPREVIELKHKPKSGQKLHSPKPHFNRPVDFEAVDLIVDLDRALKQDDFELMALSYYTLAYLLRF